MTKQRYLQAAMECAAKDRSWLVSVIRQYEAGKAPDMRPIHYALCKIALRRS